MRTYTLWIYGRQPYTRCYWDGIYNDVKSILVKNTLNGNLNAPRYVKGRGIIHVF